VKTRSKIALARVAQMAVTAKRRMQGQGTCADVVRRGVRWRLDLAEGIDFAIYLLGAFEASTVRAYRHLLAPGHVVLDIGANIGAHTLHLADAVGATGHVVAFEPTRFAFDKLCANIALNPQLAPRITAQQVMLLDRDGAVPDAVYSSWPLAAGGARHHSHLGRLQTTAGARAATLDSCVAALGLQRIDLIKLDVDGFECHVLRGAAATLALHKPTIIMELAPHLLDEHGTSLEDLLGMLAPHHYGLCTLSSSAQLPLDPAVLRKRVPPGSSLNVIVRSGARDGTES
jgi:FkbM family methyltransferase